MARLTAAVILLLLAALASAAGRLIPIDEAGYEKLLRSHRGKVVLVDLWATWCGPCREEMPFLAGLEKKYRGRGFVLITISADEPEQEAEAAAFLQKSGVSSRGYLKNVKDDDGFIRSVDPEWSGALPANILFDRKGNKAAVFIGETEPEKIEAAVRKLL